MMNKALLLPLAAIWLALTSLAAPAAEVTLRVHHFLGEDTLPHRQVIAPWARHVEQLSKGRIKVEISPAMTLGGKAPELIAQAETGVVDIIWTAAAYTPGRFARTEVFTLPLVHGGDPVATNLAIRALYEGELSYEFEKLHPLLIHVHQGHVLHMGHVTVKSAPDLKGRVIRPPGRRVGRWTIEAMGAAVTKKRHPKLPKALEQNKLDGALMSFQLADSMGVIEAVKSHTLLGEGQYFGTSLYLFLMNKARYDALPEDLQQVIDAASGADFARAVGAVYQKAGAAAMQAALQRGNSIITPDAEARAEFEQLLQETITKWARDLNSRGIDGLQLVMRARRMIARNTAR
ncbi:MAG: C4-dicarboxylate ABC transporter substrate-binding protein [Hyphomicrobiales bacterium]|nr:MAG: C4-dicarboxylate ABC transporter substrate-binding protein [Hyphomicrobiales bacterium]